MGHMGHIKLRIGTCCGIKPLQRAGCAASSRSPRAFERRVPQLTRCFSHTQSLSTNASTLQHTIVSQPSPLDTQSSAALPDLGSSNNSSRRKLRPHEFFPFCHPFGLVPPPLHDVFLDGPPPVCGLEKFKWVWENQSWTYRFTVIENKRRVRRNKSRNYVAR